MTCDLWKGRHKALSVPSGPKLQNLIETLYRQPSVSLKATVLGNNISPIGAQLLPWPLSALAEQEIVTALNTSAQIHPGCFFPE